MHEIQRRNLLLGAAAVIALPARAAPARPLAPMTEGPFYPPRAWRERWPDQDADLSRVQLRDGRTLLARGEHLGLELRVADTEGRAIDGAEIEIWQCDTMQTYRHPRQPSAPGSHDEGFQGFGATRSAAGGVARMRSIKPVPYPGRTPHIHVLLRHPSFGETISQLFLAGDPGNARDFLWRSLAPADRAPLELALQAAPQGSGLRWISRHTLVVPA